MRAIIPAVDEQTTSTPEEKSSDTRGKTAIIIGAVVLLLAIVAFGVFMMKSKTTSPEEKAEGSMKPGVLAPVEETSSTDSIASLLTQDKNITCTINFAQNGGSGSVYVASKKMRGDFITKAADKTVESHMISDGTYSYFWTGTMGTKMSIDAATKAVGTPAPGAQNQTDLNKKVDMKCSPWSVDNSKFSVPADVKFSDVSEMMKGVTGAGTSAAPKVDVSVCNQITDAAAKASCISALSK